MAAKEPTETTAKPPRRWPLIVAVVLINLVGIGGAVAYMMFFHGGSTAAAAEPAAPAPTDYGPLHELQPLVANLTDDRVGRYIRVTMHLEAADEDALELIRQREVPIRNRLLIFFSELASEDASGPGAKEALRAMIAQALNEVLGGTPVRRVFYSEFVVQ